MVRGVMPRDRVRPYLAIFLALVAALTILVSVNQTFASAKAPEAPTWTKQAPIPTEFKVNDIQMISPTEAWVISERDILHTTDAGESWTATHNPTNDALYSVNFYDAQHGIVGSNNTVLYTTDGGATWHAGEGVIGSIYFVEMASATNAFASYGYQGYFRSTDGGAHWTLVNTQDVIGAIQFFDPQNGVAFSPDGVRHTYNGGDTWTKVGSVGASFFLNHNQGWHVTGNTATRTTDGGVTWQAGTMPGNAWVYDADFTDALNGWAVGDSVVRTTDGGLSWVNVPVPNDRFLPLWTVDFIDAQHGLVGGDVLNFDTYVLGTNDAGATWAQWSNGTNAETLDLYALDSNRVWASHYFGRVSRTTNGGEDWETVKLSDQYAVMHSIDMADALNGWTVGQNEEYARIYHTTDGGITWNRQFDTYDVRLFAVDAIDAQTAFAVGGFGNAKIAERTTDGGQSWQLIDVPTNDTFYMDVYFVNATTGWITGNSGIAKTTDGGNTWAAQTTPFNYGFPGIHFSDPNNGWAGGYYGKLFRTTNGGTTWTEQQLNLPDYTHVLAVQATGPLVGWVAGYGGGAQSRPFVKQTTNGGATWTDVTPNVGPYDSFSALAFLDNDNGWAGGFDGIYLRSGSGGPLPTSTPMNTSTPSATRPASTSTPAASATAGSSSTPVPPTVTSSVPTVTAGVATATSGVPTTTPTVCAITFTDVPQGSTFYDPITCLACQGIISGYPDGTFRPSNPVTRGQLAKIVSNAAGFDEGHSTQSFEDVAVGSTFYIFVERLASRSIIGGYACGGPGEPCGSGNLPYFRPNANVTRGQTSKIVAIAADLAAPAPGQQSFEDVAETSTFWPWIEALAGAGSINGYVCGGPGEPCGIENLPYFRPSANVTRGQSARIVSATFFPGCTP